MNDGPRHTALKAAITTTVGSLDRAAIERAIDRETTKVLDDVDATGADAALDHLLSVVPVAAMAAAVGLDPGQAEQAVPASRALAAAFAPGAPASSSDDGHAGARTLLGLVSATDGGPTDQLAATIGTADAAANVAGLFFQTFDATAGLIGNTLMLLFRDPEALADVRARPGALDGVIRSVLRFDPPVHNTRRFFRHDTTIADQRISAGDEALLVLAAANRDPRAHEDFSFGTGSHRCPAHALAQDIARQTIEILVDHRPDLVARCELVGYRSSQNARIPIFRALG